MVFFGKVLNIASEVVIVQLIASKCMPILLYGLEACCLNKTDLRSLDFAVNRVFMKLFKTGNIEIVKECQIFWGLNYLVHCYVEGQTSFCTSIGSLTILYVKRCAS